MSKHTPGTWKVDQWHGEFGKMFIAGKRNGEPCIIAGELYDEDNDPTLEELEANARLIAAAPELLLLVEHLSENPYLLTPDQWQQEANDLFRKYRLLHFHKS